MLHAALQNAGTPDNAFDIAYHMWWPSGTDPFWLANQPDNQARKDYYGVSGTPTIEVDGSNVSWPSMEAGIQARLPVPSHVWLDLTMTINGSTVNVTCKAVADQNISGNVVIQFMLLDRYSYLPASPNGQPHHYHSLLAIAPSPSGQTFAVTAYDTTQYSATFTLNPSWDPTNLDLACFVQDNSTREVLQARCEQVPVDYPGLYYVAHTLQDNGNNDGRAEPGETASMYVTLGNEEPYQPAVNVVGTLSTADPDLDITTPTVNFPNIPNGGSGVNASPFVFTVDPAAQPHLTTLNLHVVADPLQTVMDTTIQIYLGWPDFLLVDDDGGSTFETYYQSTLENLGRSYEGWDVYAQGSPQASQLLDYTAIIWFTGYSDYQVLDSTEQALIQGYLENGGKLFISGQNLAQGLNAGSTAFLNDVLHASFGIANTGYRILNGVAGNPVGGGLQVNCNNGGQGSGSCSSPDGITVNAPAQAAFNYSNGTYSGALTYEVGGGEKLVYFAFPFEAINGLSGSSTQEEVFSAILDFFQMVGVEPNDPAAPETCALVQTHPNPFNPTTVISYRLPVPSQVKLEVFDLAGRPAGSPQKTRWQAAGSHEVVFDGSGLASGIYIYRLVAGDFKTNGKMVLLK